MHTLSIAAAAPRSRADPAFRADVLAGLGQAQRTVPSRWLYDHRGSDLFEALTRQPEYYPTRTERQILAEAAPAIAALTGPGRIVVEFGAGAAGKTPLLLAAVTPRAYLPIDISGDFLRDTAATLALNFPDLDIRPVEGDFTGPLPLPQVVPHVPRLGFFPGSTIGNLAPGDAGALLRAMAATLGEDALLLIGIDRMKDASILLPACDDAAGVTAFNRNLLHRINAELDGTIPVGAFRHEARWNAGENRIEMHLEATRHLAFTVEGRTYAMAAGETIHTENSVKYRSDEARRLLRAGGWSPVMEWTDRLDHFAVILARRISPAVHWGIVSPDTVDPGRSGVAP